MAKFKYNVMNDGLVEFIYQHHSFADDPVLDELEKVTLERFPEDASMQVSREQGSFLRLITQVLNVQMALEIGTFTGHSSICIARGLGYSGRLVCLDMSREWTDVAQEFWGKDGVDNKIELRLGDALESLASMPDEEVFDLVHIDAEKTLYDRFFESVLPRVRQNGLIIFDNMLWGGRVVEANQDDRTRAIKDLNRKLATDSRVESVLLPVGDGIHFCRKI